MRVVVHNMVVGFHFALDWFSNFESIYGFVIAYYDFIAPSFVVEKGVVLIVVFALISCRF